METFTPLPFPNLGDPFDLSSFGLVDATPNQPFYPDLPRTISPFDLDETTQEDVEDTVEQLICPPAPRLRPAELAPYPIERVIFLPEPNMDEHILRCNNQIGGSCRVLLKHEAIVTSCSHVFCEACAKKTGFFEAKLHTRQCLACGTNLPEPEDAILTSLYPSESYKSTCLSGLDPTTIMEIASRGLAFWNYQVLQENNYQLHINKALTNKYNSLSNAADDAVSRANVEISNLQARLQTLANENANLIEKNVELAGASREKTKKINDVRKMYDTVKQKYLTLTQEPTTSRYAEEALQHLDEVPRAVRPAGVESVPHNTTSVNQALNMGSARVPSRRLFGYSGSVSSGGRPGTARGHRTMTSGVKIGGAFAFGNPLDRRERR